MRDEDVPPDPTLLESMRAVGYSVETAVADVVDNSLAAAAGTIHVLTSAEGPFRISVFDDGRGMDESTARDAMRLAARGPSSIRDAKDLGRFGLGLKTASLSQGRTLTVATKQRGHVSIFRWSLDHVQATGRWALQRLEESSGPSLFGWELLEAASSSGTLVCWENLDLLSETEGSQQSDLDAAVSRVRDHCALVFHRFLDGLDVPKITLTVNGNPIEPLDPFLRTTRKVAPQRETLKVAGESIEVASFTLPFVANMSKVERRRAMATETLRDSQGFYIYRAGRLVIWGTWFRLNPKSELGKLARVQVDVPNSLDHLWALDIKKSSATPPRAVRDALRRLASQMIVPSRRTHEYRGRKESSEDGVTRAWNLITDHETFRYEINREHPMLQRLVDGLEGFQTAALEDILEALEQTFPVIDAHNRLSEDKISIQRSTDVEKLVARADLLWEMSAEVYPNRESFLEFLLTVEPYASTRGFDELFTKGKQS